MVTQRAVRLSDVAAVAGVSKATASKALNGSPLVSAATMARVREVADRLDFRPNALAQSFASGRSRTVGLLTHRATATFSRAVVMGAILELGRRERAALVFDGRINAHHEMSESIRTLQDRRIDGLLVVGAGYGRVTPSITHQFEVPVTYAFAASDNPDDSVFVPDNEEAGYLAARHLIERGRTRVAYVSADRDDLAVRRRETGMRRALEESGLEPVATLYGSWRQEWGEQAVGQLLAAGTAFDAVFCGNDHMGFGVLDALAVRGLRVPDDVAVVGVDNWEEVIVDQELRRLTTIDLELLRVGAVAADNVIEPSLEGGERFVEPKLIQGPSS
ncbi:LacI family transcriptional regulator [Microbacterium trichothecenolyticum]|uniref:LacI family DNA-binding transcriptional regulator n=1 Tax=Microbacterium trichothecenolyticum TaxID=69370 RepID=UPI0028559629|nr:LacI family DNA-binding transcriptional regulator [Microbacterium trichothecenolyticum]MDR7184430.1 LacI family transcriptional regulator [Microbacterium trichothecenolyticum]